MSEASRDLAHLLVAAEAGGKMEAAIRSARDRRERAERALAERSAAWGQRLDRSRATLAAVREALPANTALVAFARYQADAFSMTEAEGRQRGAADSAWTSDAPAPDEGRPSIPAYLAFAAAGADDPVGGASGRGRGDRPSGAAVARVAARPPSRRTPVPRAPSSANDASGDFLTAAIERASLDAGRSLRAAVWDPLRTHLHGADRVMVVWDGTLHLVPFPALPDAEGGYLVDSGPPPPHPDRRARRSLFYDAEVAGRGLLALGGPEFDVETRGGPTLSPGSFVPGPPASPGPTPRRSRGVRPRRAPATLGFAERTNHRFRRIRSATPSPRCPEFSKVKFRPLPASAAEARDVATLWTRTSAAAKGAHDC